MQKLDLQLETRIIKPFRLSNISVLVPNLPAEFERYTLVQLSDFHLGSATTFAHVQYALEIAMAQNPNIILLTGDYFQLESFRLRQITATNLSPKIAKWTEYRRVVRVWAKKLCRLLEACKCPDGILAVYGNHEYLEGIGTIRRQLECHVTWLCNSSFSIDSDNFRLFIAGIDDLRRGQPDLKQSLDDSRTDREPFLKLLLSHNPDVVLLNNSELLDTVNLVICGHTHGGQICLPFTGPLVTHTKQRTHVTGLSWRNNTAIYVTNGVGYSSIPLRLFCPPEITIFTLYNSA